MSAQRWVEPAVLEGELVRLEPLSRDHLTGLIEAGADPAIWGWMFRPADSPDAMASLVDEALAHAASGSEVPFATIDRQSGRVAGSTRFLAIVPEHRRLEIGWTWLGTPWQRSALNTEAKLLQLDHAFGRLGAERVEFKTDARNARSRAALLGIGATFEGIFRRHMIMADGRHRDSAWYSVIADEWPDVRLRLLARLARLRSNGG
jgi:RimJ/RimL family protein N-acetyltransferase